MKRLRFNLYIFYRWLLVEKDNVIWLIRTSTLAVAVFFIMWIFTNGVWYWLAATNWGFISQFARWYLAFLWSPWSPEKLITIPLSFKIANNIRKRHRLREVRKCERKSKMQTESLWTLMLKT